MVKRAFQAQSQRQYEFVKKKKKKKMSTGKTCLVNLSTDLYLLFMCTNEHSHTPGLTGLKVLPTGV